MRGPLSLLVLLFFFHSTSAFWNVKSDVPRHNENTTTFQPNEYVSFTFKAPFLLTWTVEVTQKFGNETISVYYLDDFSYKAWVAQKIGESIFLTSILHFLSIEYVPSVSFFCHFHIEGQKHPLYKNC